MLAQPTLLLFDGNSMAHRAYHATFISKMPMLSTSAGQTTNMLVGFLASFFKIYREIQPQKIVVCFDLPEPTFRHKQFKEYKGNRQPTPVEFIEQMDLLHEILKAFGVPIIEKGGFEADDLLATLADQGQKNKNNVVVVTGDRDCFQLVSDPFVKVLYTPTKGQNQLLDEAGVKEKIGVLPNIYLHYAALKGDTSDNLAGVAGVGEKTALLLIESFKNIDGIYKELEKHKDPEKAPKHPALKPKVTKSLIDSNHIVERNLELMELKRDVEIKLKFTDLKLGKFKESEVNRLFSLLELNKFDKDLEEIWDYKVVNESLYESIEDQIVETELETKAGDKELLALTEQIELKSKSKENLLLSIAGSWSPISEEFEGFSLGFKKEDKEHAIWVSKSLLVKTKKNEKYRKVFKELFTKSNTSPEIIAHDIKPLILELMNHELEISNLKFDTRIAIYLLSPQNRKNTIGDLLIQYGGMKMLDTQDEEKKQDEEKSKKNDQLELVAENPKGTSSLQAAALLKIYKKLKAELADKQEIKFYEDMEIPLVNVLAEMEFIGIKVDKKELITLRDKLAKESQKQRKEIIAAAGREFNVNSPKELSKVLFEDLGLPTQKRTKTGYSTDALTLEKLKGTHEIIDHILEYRSSSKLHSTYSEGLLKEIKPDGRIHATFNQTVARTGRLSSDAPNLHNIPIRTERGREFRKIFVAAKSHELLVADYNQIELRCVAHLCKDPNLIEAFITGVDVHSSVAERVFGEVPVSKQRREQAKMISYGLIYGMEIFGLAQRLNITQTEAGVILDSFFDAYPSLKEYMEETVITAKKLGYTETLFGRRRYIPDLISDNYQVRTAAERQAKNSGIQGLAADIFKYALIRINKELKTQKLKSRLVLQVHDEVILEVPLAEKKQAGEIVKSQMEAAADLDVPLLVETTYGKTWDSAKS